MLDFIEFLINVIMDPMGFVGFVSAIIAYVCFQDFLSGCQTGDWLTIICGLPLTVLFGFLAYKCLFRRN